MSDDDRIPICRGDIPHRDIRGFAPHFFGFDGWEDMKESHAGRKNISTHNNGNIVTIDGGTGPWAIRQVTGRYAGVVVTFWGNTEVNDSLEKICDCLGFEIYHKQRDLSQSNVESLSDVTILLADASIPESTANVQNRVPITD